ncbi:MAG: family 78 glycoside hydrolase catalytic domain, partial [Bacteroidales bacterium]|nr:family 78 glycoside hydrolase catalytic domain [Bacteroidales bacterium]
MEIYDLKINGIREPLGFELPRVTVSWKVCGSESKRAASVCLCVAADADFSDILCRKEGAALRSTGETVALRLSPRTRYYVRVAVTGERGDSAAAVSFFETGKMAEPFAAKWIGQQPEDRFHPVFFRRFALKEKPVLARLYASGLGLYEAYLCGEKIGGEFLTPYCSDYNEGVQVQTYDVTGLLREGDNLLEMLCGNGWFKGRLGYEGAREVYGDRFQVLAELHIRYADGSEQVCGTDESWQYRGSDFCLTDIYDGECLDRTCRGGKENPARPAALMGARKTVDRYSLPVVIKDTLPVKEVIRTPAGEMVLDFGQNFTGFVEYEAAFPAGTRITLDHGEILQNGNFYNDNYRTARAQMIYVSDGRKETVRAHFTYFGFRYVRVSGWPGELRAEDFSGRVLYSDLDTAISFSSSDKKLNRLAKNAFWGQRSNFLDMPTDCPQRDERLGWTGDAEIFARTATFNRGTYAFYSKWLKDVAFDQLPDGQVTDIVPMVHGLVGAGHVGWADAATIIPWTVYMAYGDPQVLEDQYDSMKKWVDFIIGAAGESGLWNTGWHYGDWLAFDVDNDVAGRSSVTYVPVLQQCHFANSATIVADAAKVLGRAEDEAYYRKAAAKAREAFCKAYVTADGYLVSHTQTAYVVALVYDMVPEDMRPLLAARLKERVESYGHITTGFLGTSHISNALTACGMDDVAYKLLLHKGYPGWLYPVTMGATTIWERWNSMMPDGTIPDNGMNSFNHYSYGAIGEWLYREAAGLKEAEPGFKKICVKPHPGGGFSFMKAELNTPYGKAVSH